MMVHWITPKKIQFLQIIQSLHVAQVVQVAKVLNYNFWPTDLVVHWVTPWPLSSSVLPHRRLVVHGWIIRFLLYSTPSFYLLWNFVITQPNYISSSQIAYLGIRFDATLPPHVLMTHPAFTILVPKVVPPWGNASAFPSCEKLPLLSPLSPFLGS